MHNLRSRIYVETFLIGPLIRLSSSRRAALPIALIGVVLLAAPALARALEPPLTATPQGACGPGSRPESGVQGRVSRLDMQSGRAAEGYTCNTELVSSHKSAVVEGNTLGTIGGFKVHRYVDGAGNECAYYDTTLLFPTNLGDQEGGVVVLDMSDSSDPVATATLRTPGMVSMHETLVISEERGILAGISAAAEPIELPAVLDLYDLTQDCRQPQLISSTPMPVLAHESGMSANGDLFWASMTNEPYIWAIDISEPQLPTIVYQSDFGSHGINISEDGSRAYLSQTGADRGLLILDTTELHAYLGQAPTPLVDLPVATGWADGQSQSGVPEVTKIAKLEWSGGSIPQNSVPFSSNGKQYLMEVDEYGGCSGSPANAGAARIIDINDEANPFVLSNLRLEVHNPEFFDEICDDPGARNPLQTYSAHYCHIPTRVDPTIVACSMNLSGLRVFDISDVAKPIAIAYFNAPVQPRPAFDLIAPEYGPAGITFEASNWAMSAPAFAPERNEIWFTDAFQGFYAVRLTNGAWPEFVRPEVASVAGSAPAPTSAPTSAPTPGATPLPITGAAVWLQGIGALMLCGSLTLTNRRGRDHEAGC
ncbi:MAG: hypothetical protein ACI970_000029 [Myxococcota bacterium]|jgi:hypothetical protein